MGVNAVEKYKMDIFFSLDNFLSQDNFEGGINAVEKYKIVADQKFRTNYTLKMSYR